MNHTRTILVAIVLLSAALNARQSGIPDKTKRQPSDILQKTTGTPRYTVLNIGNLTTWHRSDGQSNHSPQSDNGLYFPENTGNVIYQDGIVWGAKIFLDPAHTQPAAVQPIRVGGGTYAVGTRAGWLEMSDQFSFPVPVDPNNVNVRIYRIRREFTLLKNSDGTFSDELRRDAADFNEIPVSGVTDPYIEEVYQQYEKDWNEWPVQYGAPYIERNGVSGYQKPPAFGVGFTVDSLILGNYDEPGVAGVDPRSVADQVIYTVFNDLNSSQTQSFASSFPIGIEIQKTVWGYNLAGSLGNLYFARYRFLNKGGVDIDTASGFQGGTFFLDSMYVGQWSDPDIGDLRDDLVGCDTTLDLGFAYNAFATDVSFRIFSLPPPSVGYRYLQGPLIPSPGDTAFFGLRKKHGFRNLRPSSFGYMGAGSPYSDPPNGVSSGYSGTTGQWWKLLRGFAPLGTMMDPDVPYFHPSTIPATKFPLSGDPVTGTGFLDEGPSDRRILLTSGPFSLAPGDTQEILVAFIAGLGSDRHSSVGAMKANSALAQGVYQAFFAVPRPPARPDVRVIGLDRQIILEWGSNHQRVAETEEMVILSDYRFEGYNIYQLPAANSQLEFGWKIATFDVKNGLRTITEQQFDPLLGNFQTVVLQVSTDSGIRRHLRIKNDQLENPGGLISVRNGKEYFFAVTAYNYSPTSPRSLESDPVIVRVKPHIPFGINSQVGPGDTLTSIHPQGSSAGTVFPIILDPTSGTGDTYEVRFDTSGATVSWSVFNLTQNRSVITGQTNQSGDEDYPILEGGILLKVTDDPAGTQKNSPADIFQFTVPPTVSDQNAVKASVQRIGVFPNPYYSARDQETTTWRKFVTFSNLPPKATIRIFNLAGHLVRTLQKDDQSQFFEWDLTNESNWQVASGIYVCYVEMPEIGETKVLKLAVIQPQIVPGR